MLFSSSERIEQGQHDGVIANLERGEKHARFFWRIMSRIYVHGTSGGIQACQFP
jgi:hypothetical protein